MSRGRGCSAGNVLTCLSAVRNTKPSQRCEPQLAGWQRGWWREELGRGGKLAAPGATSVGGGWPGTNRYFPNSRMVNLDLRHTGKGWQGQGQGGGGRLGEGEKEGGLAPSFAQGIAPPPRMAQVSISPQSGWEVAFFSSGHWRSSAYQTQSGLEARSGGGVGRGALRALRVGGGEKDSGGGPEGGRWNRPLQDKSQGCRQVEMAPHCAR